MLSKTEYEAHTAATRNARMKWWREARFGIFVHYGLYSILARQEWAQAVDNIPAEEYEKLADDFQPREGAPREWARLAKEAGAKYMVLTTRHHEGFSLWDSKTNPFNSVNLGPRRDIVREFVDACREFDLRIGFYSSLMDWHHPDGWRCAFDPEANRRFLRYIRDLNTELLTNYGKIDILWYDVPQPMEHWEGWGSLERNQHLRALQPDILINDRSLLDEDFGTPEEHIQATDRDWEACMTFNGLSWGYVDSQQAAPYSYNAQAILKMLGTCAGKGGNLLLNIGPTPDGSVPPEAVEPLQTVGRWLGENGRAVYGPLEKSQGWRPDNFGGSFLAPASFDGKSVYLWMQIWPDNGQLAIGGYRNAPKAIRLLRDGTPLHFEHKGHRIRLKNLPKQAPDPHAGVSVIELEFEDRPEYLFASYYPQLHRGRDIVKGLRE